MLELFEEDELVDVLTEVNIFHFDLFDSFLSQDKSMWANIAVGRHSRNAPRKLLIKRIIRAERLVREQIF
jgi:hypothetical protein